MKRKIVLFDIDYTLFNALLFRKTFFEILVKHTSHTDRERFLERLEEVYEQAKAETSFFDPKSFLDLLDKQVEIKNKSQLEKEIMREDRIEASLYKEVKNVMKELSKNDNVFLGIYSWGSIPVQIAKIKSLEEFLHHEHIHDVEFDKRTTLRYILEQYKNDTLYLIDDYQEVLAIAKNNHPDVHAIWIHRPEIEGKQSRIFANFAPDSIIGSLEEVVPLILNN